MRQRSKSLLTLVLATVVVCWCTAVGAAPDAKVAWAGETFLDVTYKQVDERQIKDQGKVRLIL